MRFVLTRDPEEFAGRASGFLAARVECNVMATVLMSTRAGPHPPPLFACGYDAGGELRAAALRTPPHPLLVTDLGPEAAQELIDVWLDEDPDVPGVSGTPAAAAAIATAWSRRTGGTTTCRLHEAFHVLDEVHDPPRPAPGELRVAEPRDRELLLAWTEAFELDAGVHVKGQAARMVDSRLPYGGMLLWEDDGPASMVGVTRPVAEVVRIAPVYTPPEHRRRGYAGTAVAAASRRALAGGARRCMLYTDLANPTSNKIYCEVGYRRVGDWEEHVFRGI